MGTLKFRRLIAVAAAALLLTSCSDGGILAPKAPDMDKSYKLTAQVTAGESGFTADFNRKGTGIWTITLTEPYEAQGLVINYKSGAVSASMGDFSAENLTDDFAYSPISAIISAMEEMAGGNGKVTVTDDGSLVQTGECLMLYGKGSSSPKHMELPNQKISAEITNFTVTGSADADVILDE